jgi:hypothetical protein
MRVPDDRLRRMNDEIRDIVARRGNRRAEDLVPDVSAVMRRYGVAEPDTEGLLLWIDKTIVEVDAAG